MLAPVPNFAAQYLSHVWSGGTYYDALARAFAHRLSWGQFPTDSRVHRAA